MRACVRVCVCVYEDVLIVYLTRGHRQQVENTYNIRTRQPSSNTNYKKKEKERKKEKKQTAVKHEKRLPVLIVKKHIYF